MGKCERCGAVASGYNIHDYCAECHAPLCSSCMASGCCDEIPAESGTERDYPDDDDDDDDGEEK